jgi:polysaccharide export outer membrane protein
MFIMEKCRQYLANGLICFAITLVFASCTEFKSTPYFRDISDHARDSVMADAVYKDPVILPDDILSITIVTIDPTTSAPVNQAANVPVATSLVGVPTIVPGILVDKEGKISLPIIGSVKVGGLTSFEAKALIKKEAVKYYKDPDVQLRFANFSITVLGEVVHPATFTMPNEKVDVLDALGMAGDLTIYGRRDNVLVIREANGKKQVTRLNLNNSEMFKSPYFYLRQNDVVYVEPNHEKIIAADAARTRTYTILGAVAAVLIVFFTHTKI